jgi:hypothetical protein
LKTREALLGIETRRLNPLCAVSVPNRFANRLNGLDRRFDCLNMRRLMYQPLICLSLAADQASSLRTPLDLENMQCAADPLVDSMRRNVELDRDFLGRKMLVDESQAVELSWRQPRDAPFGTIVRVA